MMKIYNNANTVFTSDIASSDAISSSNNVPISINNNSNLNTNLTIGSTTGTPIWTTIQTTPYITYTDCVDATHEHIRELEKRISMMEKVFDLLVELVKGKDERLSVLADDVVKKVLEQIL